MRVLVTGGAGFIGSHLVVRLVRDQVDDVIVVDNLHRGSLENLAQCFERIRFVKGDIRDRGLLTEWMRGAEVVYHLAAQSNVMGAEEEVEYSFSTNVTGTLNVLRAACEAGVRRLVFTSSREVYGDPDSLPVPETAPLKPKNAYGASKVAAEMYCRVFAGKGVQVSILRLANVYGARDFGRVIPIFLDNAFKGEPLTIYGGQQTLDFVWIDTAVEGLLRAGAGNFVDGAVNIGSGTGIAISELARRILAQTGSTAKLRFGSSRDVEVTRFVADIVRMETKLGLQPDGEPLSHLAELITQARIIAEFTK
jgi:UDP-glucose 4-epimerase